MKKLLKPSPIQAIKKFSKLPRRLSPYNSEKLSAFCFRVYKQVKKIPHGRVVTYGQIARAIGAARAGRAVGNALNKNIFPDVPCHRVVRADGSVGGYAWGTLEKINMLNREGVCIEDGCVDLLLLH